MSVKSSRIWRRRVPCRVGECSGADHICRARAIIDRKARRFFQRRRFRGRQRRIRKSQLRCYFPGCCVCGHPLRIFGLRRRQSASRHDSEYPYFFRCDSVSRALGLVYVLWRTTLRMRVSCTANHRSSFILCRALLRPSSDVPQAAPACSCASTPKQGFSDLALSQHKLHSHQWQPQYRLLQQKPSLVLALYDPRRQLPGLLLQPSPCRQVASSQYCFRRSP